MNISFKRLLRNTDFLENLYGFCVQFRTDWVISLKIEPFTINEFYPFHVHTLMNILVLYNWLMVISGYSIKTKGKESMIAWRLSSKALSQG